MGSEGQHTVHVTSVCKSAVSAFVVCISVWGLFSVIVSEMGDGYDAVAYTLGLSN